MNNELENILNKLVTDFIVFFKSSIKMPDEFIGNLLISI